MLVGSLYLYDFFSLTMFLYVWFGKNNGFWFFSNFFTGIDRMCLLELFGFPLVLATGIDRMCVYLNCFVFLKFGTGM